MKENMEFIKKEDLKETIIEIMDDMYIPKDKICELLEKAQWSGNKYDTRDLQLWHEICEMVGKEYYHTWCTLNRWSKVENDR